jgi:GTP-binding protein HflX
MFERPSQGERAVLVHMVLSAESKTQASDRDVLEFTELVRSTGAQQVGLLSGKRQAPDARVFIGKGKLEELSSLVLSMNADLVVFDHVLSPSQERNLEKELQCRVLDRTGLILDIFAQRAQSYEGKLQVELAQLRHLSTRLVRGWTHLERQKGGIGMRGPGEKQLETDRRLLTVRIQTINRRLTKVRKQRNQGRQQRKKADIPTISLVGYTNAGKSTLFNAMTGADVYAADQLFATLDPTLRRADVSDRQSVVLADTVGFIRQLPHDLVAAFRATLQETEEADLLLHVIDANDPLRDIYIKQVNEVLAEIGAQDLPQIHVYNKIDLADIPAKIRRDPNGCETRIWVSAKTGVGLDLLKAELDRYFEGETLQGILTLPMKAGHIRAELFAHGAGLQESVTEDGKWRFEVRMAKKLYQRLSSQYSDIEWQVSAGLTGSDNI